MFDNFPYTNFHEMNLDWMIKIAKDFLDQYTHIQETITQGLEDLDQKAQDLEQLLQAWYDEHSQDIANQLADALNDLNDWYTEHQGFLDQYLQDAISDFNDAADAKAAQTIASIPSDYTELSNKVLATNYNNFYGWFAQLNPASIPNTLTQETNGLLKWTNTIPSSASYCYIALDMGTYGILKNISFVYSLENTSDLDLRYRFRLSKQGSWAPVYSPVVLGDITIKAKEEYINSFVPSINLDGLGYTDNDHVFMLIEQVTYPNVQITNNVKLVFNATNSIKTVLAENTLNGGIEQLPNNANFLTQNMINTFHASITGDRGLYKITIPANSGSVDASYASIAFPFKKYVTDKRKIRFTLEKDNTNAIWNWDACRLSTVFNNWAPTVLIQLLTNSPGNVNRKTFEIDFADYDIDTSLYENIYLIFDTFINAPSASEAVTLTLKLELLTNGTIVAQELEGFFPDDYFTKEETERIFGLGYNVDMLFWGDSLTAGAGGSGVTYCSVCAQLLGKSHKNAGVGGEAEQTIAARQGGNNLIIPAGPVNGTYTPSQMKDAYGKQIEPLIQGGNDTVNPVIINGQSCTLTYANGNYTISGYTGNLQFDTPALFHGYTDQGDITIIFVGANGLGINTVDERINYIRSMLTRVGKKYVVMGLSYGTEAERATDDQKMHAEFGNHFFATRSMLVRFGLTVAGITPTAQDIADMNNGVVPTSLRSDHIHLNADGYTALGKMLAGFIVGLGYAKYA